MRAMTAPASARSSSDGPNAAPASKPPGMFGATRIAVNVESAPPIAHASVDMRDANTPAMRAASGFAAALRSARPKRLRRRNTASPTTSSGAKNSIPVAAGWTISVPTSKRGRPGGGGKNSPCSGRGRGLQRDGEEELADAERRDDGHEPRRVAQPADDRDLGQRRDAAADGERERAAPT